MAGESNSVDEQLATVERIMLNADKFNAAVDKKDDLILSKADDMDMGWDCIINTPQGAVSAHTWGNSSNFLIDLTNLSIALPKNGNYYNAEKTLKDIGYTKDNLSVQKNLTAYYAYQTVAQYIEQNKNTLSAEDYQLCQTNLKNELSRTIKNLNLRGICINTKTGEPVCSSPLQLAYTRE